MIITAKHGGTCRKCGRKIYGLSSVGIDVVSADLIEWEDGKGAEHYSPSCEEVRNRAKGTAALAKPLELPHHPEDEAPIDWSTYRPRDPGGWRSPP